jgi:acetylornithine deacetylase/succinyl-diaminopimelate desuccinylase-like protein
VDFIQACRQLISIDSSPGAGSFLIMQKAAELCRAQGLHVEIQEEFSGDTKEANLIARFSEKRPDYEFLFQTHLDTVDPGPYSMWTETSRNPFDATIRDGKIYGLGAADVKLDFLCKLQALSQFKDQKNWKTPPVLVATYGEETGMVGALKLIRKNRVSSKMALIGEATDLQLVYAGKGFASVEIRIPFSKEELQYRLDHNLRESTSTQSKLFHGVSAHSSTPQLGDSAVLKMLNYLLMLPESVVIMEIDGGTRRNSIPGHAFLEIDATAVKNSMISKVVGVYKSIQKLEKEFLNFTDHEFIPSTPTLNIGIIRTLEDQVLLGGSCRIPPMISQETYENWMRLLQSDCEKFGAEFRVTDYKKPFRTNDNSVFVKGCMDEIRALGLKNKLGTLASANEASLFSRVGVDCLVFGAGRREANIHTATEHVLIEDLDKSTQFYSQVLKRFCL